MEKIWFFVEGESEENFIKNLIRLKYSESILLEKDLSAFATKNIASLGHHLGYCENCHNVEKIPHRINDILYLIEKSNSSKIIVICDIENLQCFSARKNKINGILKNTINRNNILYVFFNPMIEVGYWDSEEIIKKIIQVEYKEKFAKDYQNEIVLMGNGDKPLQSLKNSFRKYDVNYRESKFSEMFFPRVDYNNCQNSVLHRIVTYLDHI